MNELDFFERVLTLYGQGETEEARSLLVNAAEEQEKNENFAFATKAYTQASICSNRLVQSEKALQYLDKALKLFLKQNSLPHKYKAKIYQTLGNAYSNQEDYTRSNDNLQKALEIINEPENKTEENLMMSIISSMANNFSDLGLVQKAIPLHQRCYKYYVKNKKWISAALMSNNLGNQYFFLKELNNALTHYKKAISINRSKCKDVHDPNFSLYYSNISITLRHLSDFMEALKFSKLGLEESLRVYGQDSLYTAYAYCEVSSAYKGIGDLYLSLIYIDRAIQLFKKLKNKYKLADALVGKAAIFLLKGDYTEQIRYLLEAKEIMNFLYDDKNIHLATIINNLGDAYSKQGDNTKAITYFKILTEAEDKSNYIAQFNLATVYLEQKEYSNASCILKKLLKKIDKKEIDKAYLVSCVFLNCGKLYCEKNDLDLAFKMFNKMLKYYHLQESISIPNNIPNTLDVSNPIQFIEYLSFIAETITKFIQLDNNAMIHYYETAIKLCNLCENSKQNILQSYLHDNSFYFPVSNNFDFYLTGISASLSIFETTHDRQYLFRALQFADLGKASSIKEKNCRESDINTQEIDFLSAEIFDLELQFRMEENPNEEKDYQKEIFNKKIKLTELISEEKRKALLKFPDIGLNSLKSIQNILKDDEILMEFYTGKTETFQFIITKETILYQKIKTEKLKKEIKLIVNFLDHDKSERDVIRCDFDHFKQTAHNLYLKLIYPFEENFNGQAELLIIPHNFIDNLVFDILIPDIKSFKINSPESYLINRYAISYYYSTELLLYNRSKKGIQTKEDEIIKIFAPSYPKQTKTALVDNFIMTIRGNEELDNELLKELKELQSEKEIEQILENLKYRTQIFNKEKASVSNFLKNSNSTILHISAHAVLCQSNPDLTSIVCSNNDDDHKYLLTASMIKKIEMSQVQLAFLNCCNTGLGLTTLHEGILSLSRAFTYAGVKNVIYTLNRIEEDHALLFSKKFYQNFTKNTNFRKKLQQVKIDMIEKYQSKSVPFFWCSYQLNGF